MTAATVSFTEDDVFVALRGLLLSMLPPGVEVVRGQVNRVPEPFGSNFVMMNPLRRTRLETNTDTVFDGFFSVPPTPGIKTALQPIEYVIQIDVHGPASGDNVQIISTLFRDEYATSYFDDQTAVDAQVLYAGEPRQLLFVNGERQSENRWSVELAMQLNQVVTISQDFAGTVDVGLINVDAVYPP